MKFLRAVVVLDAAERVRPALAALCATAPTLLRLSVVAPIVAGSIEQLRTAIAAELSTLPGPGPDLARTAEVRVVPLLDGETLVDAVIEARAELLVVGATAPDVVAACEEVRARALVPLLHPRAVADAPSRVTDVLCVVATRKARLAIGALLRDRAESFVRVTLLSPSAPAPDALDVMLEVVGIEAAVQLPTDAAWLRRLVAGETRTDLVVVPRLPTALLGRLRWPAPVLVLPPPVEDAIAERLLDVPDVVADGEWVRLRASVAALVGDLPPYAEAPLTVVSSGIAIASGLTSRTGDLELKVPSSVRALGIARGVREDEVPLAAIEQQLAVVRPPDHGVLVVDAGVSDAVLDALVAEHGADALVAVRLRPTRTADALRARLRQHGVPGRVLDARAVLDEGEALDVSSPLDALRLARVARRLCLLGFDVRGIVPAEPASAAVQPLVDAPHRAPLVPGNRIEVELDNRRARRWLVDGIAAARRWVAIQVYIVSDDDVGREVEAAIAGAVARGVEVRLLVDSLYSLHGSFGIENPLLSRLAALPNVELRVARPIEELPTLADIKQRDHRKVVLLDGEVALIGGRNLAHEYYMGFEEVALGPRSSWREVPWLDAGARIEGPLVADIARSFWDAWSAAGGTPREVVVPPTAGTTPAQVVVHHGLRDVATLEAYLSLIAEARSHVYVVNGFPLALELQHALLRALARGVQVTSVVGHVTPTHGEEVFGGLGGTARGMATQLVHARVDALIDAGARAFHFALEGEPGWDPALGVVHPHVHAKLVSVDGERCAVGSANLDVTSAYWESELMVIVHDPAVVAPLEASIEARLRTSELVDRDDPEWRELAQRRAWMRHWPGLIG